MENLSDKDATIFNDTQKQNLPNATAVLVLGIISIIGCCCYGLIGTICGIIALVLASKDSRRYMATPQLFTISSYNNLTAGRICAIIGTIISILYLIAIIIIIAVMGFAALSHPDEWLRQYQHY